MDMNELDVESAQRARIWRSKEARGVRDAFMNCVERGALRDFSAGKLRLGKMTFTAMCHSGCVCRMLLDVDAGTLTFCGFLPGVSERSPLFKEVKNFLRPFATEQVPAQQRIDPAKGEIQLTTDRTGLTLVMRVKNAEFEHCAARLVNIAEEVSRVFTPSGHYFTDRPQAFAVSSGVAQ